MIEACMSPEFSVGIQSLGLLAIAFKFSYLQKETIKANYNDRCAQTGTKKNLECHHIVCQRFGGRDIVENGVPLTSKVHKEWDRRTIEEGICYPGIPIDQMPVELFKSPKLREKVIYQFRRKGVL